ncbi:MAG: alpha/beta hydrolase [Lachnospiraceae bacterium]|nr:alpha/beta hydrolase [Lachnospiraceae bacterium]
MILEKIDIRNADSESYAQAVFYGQEDREGLPIGKRPVLIVVPGGGYDHTSVREGEIVAMQFLSFGYHAAVLNYSCAPARYPTALLELAALMKTLRERAEEWHIDPDQLIPVGFSAGGHLVGCLSAFWWEPWLPNACDCPKEQLRPNAQILCYPVITSGEYAHAGSFENLLGDRCESAKDTLSLEKRMNPWVPRSFVWHTFADRSVPVQNSLLYVEALAKQGISAEYHLFEHGVHGSALGSKLSAKEEKHIEPSLTPWIHLAHTWIERGLV